MPEKTSLNPECNIAYNLLTVPMPQEALHPDTSRGFELTSIKAAYQFERMSEVFGPLGYGWRYAASEPIFDPTGTSEVLVRVAVQYRLPGDQPGCWPLVYGPIPGQPGSDFYLDDMAPPVWSEPIMVWGGASTKRKGSVPYTDALRSAVTNGITKAMMNMGIGLEIWKGQPENSEGLEPGKPARAARRQQTPGPRRSQTPAKQPAQGVPPLYASLDAMKAAAAAELAKISVPGQAEEKTLAAMARKMAGLNFKMQPARLLHVLFGPGELTAQRVLAAMNFLAGRLTSADVQLLNEALDS